MKYILLNEKKVCSKCNKNIYCNMFHVDDHIYACIECATKYENELMEEIKNKVLDYFQPERLNPEAPNNGDAIV